MTKAKKIKCTSVLFALLLCGVSVAGPTYSFVRMAGQSESTGLSQPGYAPWSLGASLGKALTLYSDIAKQNSSDVEIFDELSGLAAFCTDPVTPSSNPASFFRRNNDPAGSSSKNPEFSDSRGFKWGYWTRSTEKGSSSLSKWYQYGLPNDFTHPNFPDKPDCLIIKPDSPVGPDGSSVVPAPAAISLGCLGLILVGWLRNRKTF